MFSGKKKEKKPVAPTKPRSSDLAQLGIFEVPDLENLDIDGGGNDNDDDLEAELLALTGGGGRPATKANKNRGKGPVDSNVLDKMVAECMSDDITDDLSDEEDADLLAELSALTPEEEEAPPVPEPDYIRPAPPLPSPKNDVPQLQEPPPDYDPPKERNPEPIAPRAKPAVGGHSLVQTLQERIILYEQAEANAIVSGENSRARRFNRGLKTLTQMLKSVRAGRSINEDDIPPLIVVRGATPASSAVQSPASSNIPSPVSSGPSVVETPSPLDSGPSQITLANLPEPPTIPPSVEDYSSRATNFPTPDVPRNLFDNIPSIDPPIQTIPASVAFPNKEPNLCDILKSRHTQYKLSALDAKRKGNKELAITQMRTMKQIEFMLKAVQAGEEVDQSLIPPDLSNSSASRETLGHTSSIKVPGNVEAASQESANNASSPLEALEQRLGKYVEQRDKANNDGNARKVRMNERIMKQYQDAIRSLKLGRHVDFNELPTPPGFPPISAAPARAAPVAPQPSQVQAPDQSTGEPPAKQAKPTGPKPAPAAPPKPPINVRKTPQSRVEKQLNFLLKRQQQFKKAALEAKKRGEIEQAKEYLRNAKGFDQLIEASKGGLPVDLNTVPIPPQDQVPPADLDYEMVEADDCIMAPPKTDADVTIIYTKLEEDLKNQIKMCAQTREHFKAIGDVASANRFEQLILHTKKDLDSVKGGFKTGRTPPKFHYENRSFNIIQCNTDLNDSDCEVMILRGINFNVPNPTDIDTFVKVEFPFPADNPPQDKSDVIKDTNNPEYNFKSIFSIERKSRALARLFKRNTVKIEIYAKGGWFSRSTVMGTVKVPLVELETKCTLHDSFNILDDRKKVAGGKLEVRIRLRNPIVSKELKKITEKWLVIEGF